MKSYLYLAGLLLSATLFFSCNSNSEKSETSRDSVTASHDSTTHQDTATTPANPMMEMHDAMVEMEKQMKASNFSGDPDYDFAMMMKHHHESAVRMAKAELAGGTDEQMKQMAQTMINEQQREIDEFNKFIQTAPAPGTSDYGKKAMGMLTPMEKIDMSSSTLDGMFARMMIPHHKDAVKMAKEYLKLAKNETIKKLATDIVNTQPKEIKALEDWVASHD